MVEPRRNQRTLMALAVSLLLALAGANLASSPEAGAGPPPGGEEKIPVVTIPSQYQWGANGTGAGQFLDITGVNVGPDGNVYVTDCDLRRVQAMTLQGAFVRQIGGPDRAAGGLRCPRDVAVAPDGRRVYVLDSADGRVLEYSSEGTLIRTVVSDDTLADAWGLATDGNLMVVTDPGTESVRFYEGGRPLSRCHTSSDAAIGRFARPLGVTLATTGHAYVADQQNHRILRLDPHCSVDQTFGRYGSLAGDLAEPADVEFANGRLFVADMTNHRLQAFDVNGKFLLQWGRHPSTAHEGHGRTHYPSFIATDRTATRAVVCEPFENRCQTFDLVEMERLVSRANDQAYGNRIDVYSPQGALLHSFGRKGTGPGEFNLPTGVKYNRRLRRIYVMDSYNQRVQFFDVSGRYLGEFGGNGFEPGKIINAIDLAIDEQDHIYIPDAATNRIQKFDADGRFIRQWGSFGSAPGQFYKLKGAAVLRDRLLVIDFGNHRGQIFDLDGKPLGVFGEGILSPVPDTPHIFKTANVARQSSSRRSYTGPLFGAAGLVTLAVALGCSLRRRSGGRPASA